MRSYAERDVASATAILCPSVSHPPIACQNGYKYYRDYDTIRYDTIEEFNMDSKAEYSDLSSTRSQKKKLKQTTPVPP